MKISFNTLTRWHPEEEAAIRKAVTEVIDSGYYVLGPRLKEFEQNFASYMGAKHGIGTGNGLDALVIALRALGIGEGDEVITPALSFAATALAIRAVGATIVFIDIDDFYHIDTSKIESAITARTKAIVPVHLYGQSANVSSLKEISEKHKLFLIEDSAQAHGVTWNGSKIGPSGEFSCFSFYPTKNLGAMGDGGMILTNDEALAEKCRTLRNYGQKTRYEHVVVGMNSRLDEIQAAILNARLPFLDRDNARRAELAKMYEQKLSHIQQVKIPKTREGSNHIYHLYVIEAENRDALQSFLKEKGIDTIIHYMPLHTQPCFGEYSSLKFPRVESVTQKILSLPLNAHLKTEEIEYICKSIGEFYSK